MEIKWSKFIIERLKPNDRTVRIYTLCIALIMPIKILYTDFVMWRERMRRKVSTTPQVCMIKKSVWDELKLAIEINEGNGKPFDFIIKTDNSNIDVERRMFALINRAKLAGKSYGYENAKITITSVWNRYVCELSNVDSRWSEYMCERMNVLTKWNRYVCEVVHKQEVYLTIQIIGYGQEVKVISPIKIDRDISIKYRKKENDTIYIFATKLTEKWVGDNYYYSIIKIAASLEQVEKGSFELITKEDAYNIYTLLEI